MHLLLAPLRPNAREVQHFWTGSGGTFDDLEVVDHGRYSAFAVAAHVCVHIAKSGFNIWPCRLMTGLRRAVSRGTAPFSVSSACRHVSVRFCLGWPAVSPSLLLCSICSWFLVYTSLPMLFCGFVSFGSRTGALCSLLQLAPFTLWAVPWVVGVGLGRLPASPFPLPFLRYSYFCFLRFYAPVSVREHGRTRKS